MISNLYIVGAPKCGTTSLARYLGGHSEICISSPKETNYFSRESIENDNLYYEERVVSDADAYLKCFDSEGGSRYYCDASVSYFAYEDVPRKIKDYNPSSKVIVLLREPLARAFSHYLMDCRLGYIDVPFETIFDNPDLYKEHYNQYFGISCYFRHVERYIEAFGSESVKLVFDSDLKADPQSTLSDICSFLELEFDPLMFTDRVHNVYKSPRNRLVGFAYKQHKLRHIVQRYLPRTIQEALKRILFIGGQKPSIPSSSQLAMMAFFSTDVEKLERLLGRRVPEAWQLRR